MLKKKYADALAAFNDKYKKLGKLKPYSSHVLINNKIAFLKKLPKGIKAICSFILDFMEARVGTSKDDQDYYMHVYASQEEIGKELGYSREYISKCISIMSRTEDCPFIKIRQGLGKANYYIMEEKKSFLEDLAELFKLKTAEQGSSKSNSRTGKKSTKGSFGDFDQRDYDFDDLERKLLGWTNT